MARKTMLQTQQEERKGLKRVLKELELKNARETDAQKKSFVVQTNAFKTTVLEGKYSQQQKDEMSKSLMAEQVRRRFRIVRGSRDILDTEGHRITGPNMWYQGYKSQCG